MPEAIGHCDTPACDVLLSGICAQGHTPLSTCPTYLMWQEDQSGTSDLSETHEEADSSLSEAKKLLLASGEPLDAAGVQELLSWKAASLITIVGDRDSGKSTLVCSIYDRFLRGPFGSYAFCSSRTLVGLEKRSHYARVDSGRTQPETARTPISEGLRYFHFAVSPTDDLGNRIDLLISDRAGEVYRLARGNSALVASLEELATANHVVILLDGGRVADPIERSGAMQSVRQTLRAFLDGGALSDQSCVQVVTTKLDVLVEKMQQADLDSLFTPFEASIMKDFGPRLKELTFWKTAARDPKRKFDPAFGVDTLVEKWASTGPTNRPIVQHTNGLSTEFDKLLTRTPIVVEK